MGDKEKARETATLKKMSEKVIKRLCKVNNCKDPFLNIGALLKALRLAREEGRKENWTVKDLKDFAGSLKRANDKGREEGRREERERCVAVTKKQVVGIDHFDSSDPRKWGEEYLKIIQGKVLGWNKVRDFIAKAIESGEI